jgi:hypothetical protein
MNPLLIFFPLLQSFVHSMEVPFNEGKIDRLYAEAEKQETVEGIVSGIKKLSGLVHEQHYVVPLFERYSLYRINPATIKSLGKQHRPHFLDLSLIEMR